MAIDKLSLYNNALTLIGQRTLDNLTEDRPSRYALDAAYDLDAIAYCLEIVKPVFARKTITDSSSTTSSGHDLDNVFTLPADYLSLIGVYSDAVLDEEIERYIIEGNTLACEHATIYLRYVSDDAVTVFTYWSPSFAQVVSSFLAREISVHIAPKQTEQADAKFVDRIKSSIEMDKDREPTKRSSASTVTMTNEWRAVYNDALLIMGLPEITSNNDDSNRRSKLDHALNSGVVKALLEITGWTFATQSTKSIYDPSVEPSWGFKRAHAYPPKMHRIDGYFYDEYMRNPLKLYTDEGDKIFTDEDEIYVKFISTDFLTDITLWPMHFQRLVGARMAADAAGSLKSEGADLKMAREIYEDREETAKSIDTMASPPRVLSGGKWAGSRYTGRYNGRP